MTSRRANADRPRVAIVGAGPAGLSAAVAAARAGASVIVLDERDVPGGRLRYEKHPSKKSATLENLLNKCRDIGVEVVPRVAVWGIFPDWRLACALGTTSTMVKASAVILATGSTDLALPFASSTLPGVMTATGVLRLIEQYRVLPGRRFVVIGQGAEASSVRSSIEGAGGHIVLSMTAEEGRGLIVGGDGGVERVTHRSVSYPADIVVVAVGRLPDVQLAAMCECRLVWSLQAGWWAPWRDDRCQTSQRGLFAAGDCAGVATIDTTLAEGTYSGLCAAAVIGLVDEAELDRARKAFNAVDGSRFGSMLADTGYGQPWAPLMETAP